MSDNNRRTSINLDDETHEIAKRLGNRSEFVRECLRRWNAWDTGTHVQPERSEIDLGKKCFPKHKKGCCVICWPDGPPHPEDWSYYMSSGGKVVVGKGRGEPRFLKQDRTTTNGLRRRPDKQTLSQISIFRKIAGSRKAVNHPKP